MTEIDCDNKDQHISNFEMNETYWKEAFYQSYFYGSIKGKLGICLGTLTFVAGVGMIFTPLPWFASTILIVIGLFESIGLPVKFKIWQMRNGLKDKYFETITFTFDGDTLSHQGKTSEGKILWSGLKKWKETPKGFLLWPQKRIQFYIPKYSLASESIEFLRNKCLGNIKK
ncbi:MAG: YcxB family protein [Cellvibrio sp.]|nr:YcxB family protein [Cellvibrio sp.]